MRSILPIRGMSERFKQAELAVDIGATSLESVIHKKCLKDFRDKKFFKYPRQCRFDFTLSTCVRCSYVGETVKG